MVTAGIFEVIDYFLIFLRRLRGQDFSTYSFTKKWTGRTEYAVEHKSMVSK
jgi:hypothetical protein